MLVGVDRVAPVTCEATRARIAVDEEWSPAVEQCAVILIEAKLAAAQSAVDRLADDRMTVEDDIIHRTVSLESQVHLTGMTRRAFTRNGGKAETRRESDRKCGLAAIVHAL